jgi:hypothetical protein
MSQASATVPEEWRALFEGRNVVFAGLPPAPPKAASRVGKWAFRVVVIVIAIALAIGAGFGLSTASGRWWVGLIGFAIVAWIASLLAIGMVGAIKVEREALAKRRASALIDPIGRLLPDRGTSRKAFRDPASYAGLFTLAPRPALIFDVALFDLMQRDKLASSLAPRGRLPEPEILETSAIPAGTSFFGLMLLFQTTSTWAKVIPALWSGAPLHWSLWYAIPIFVIGAYLIVRDPWLRRKLNIPRLFGADSIIGAGWIRDSKGEVWTVDDSIVLVTLAGGGMEVRLIKPTKVLSFYLPVMMGKPGTGRSKKGAGFTGLGLRGRAKAVAVDAARGAVEAVGIEGDEAPDFDMPSSKEPLRLLLSSWTYPEPRTDLAMRA